MLADLSGKTALVTGGGHGIGRGIVLAMAEQGADVAIADINDDGAAAVVGRSRRVHRAGFATAQDLSVGCCLTKRYRQTKQPLNPDSDQYSSTQ